MMLCERRAVIVAFRGLHCVCMALPRPYLFILSLSERITPLSTHTLPVEPQSDAETVSLSLPVHIRGMGGGGGALGRGIQRETRSEAVRNRETKDWQKGNMCIDVQWWLSEREDAMMMEVETQDEDGRGEERKSLGR